MMKFLGGILLPIWLGLSGCSADHSGHASSTKAEAQTGRSKYPIVLAHGAMGFDKILFMDYFFGIPDRLRDLGYQVYAPRVAPVNSAAFRAHQLAAQIDQILKATGAAKVNIIAHSMGGLDARYLVSSLGYGDRVASITTISTPHAGTFLADIAYFTLGGHEQVMQGITTLMGVSSSSDKAEARLAAFGDIDFDAALYNLTTAFAKDHFNVENRDDDRVFYQSWGGHAPLADITAPDWISALLRVQYDVLALAEGDNDGMVSVASARHGLDHGFYPAHHLDEIGQMFGHQSYQYDYQSFFIDMVADLAKRGL